VTRPVVVVGDALLDRDVDGSVERVCPDAPAPVVDSQTERSRPGGAALAAALAASDGTPVTLVTALARDHAGDELRALIEAAGVTVVDAGLQGRTPEKVRVLANGHPIMRIDRGDDTAAVGDAGAAVRRATAHAAAVLVADYGRGVVAAARTALAPLAASMPVVWDPHPRGAAPVPGTFLVTPNERELFAFAPLVQARARSTLGRATVAARALARRWQVHAVGATLGARGAMVVHGDGPALVVPAAAVSGTDTCGAGDRFSSAATVALANGAVVSEAVEQAVSSATAFVAAGGASAFDAYRARDPGAAAPYVRRQARDVVEVTRARGGVVVATGGCFDLLHVGHIATLRAARQLGDCLVVLVNSDTSARRLKGPDRPVQCARDRAAVVEALDCVDAVEVFDNDTPVRALETLQPDIFAKGGDYALEDLPETRALARWGGHVVVLPYFAGRSTTHIMQEVQRRGRA
jgi:rfaE bifunctional protein nucleotidyltransferase chain/domain/rfaE bifunctional protein kinase chain/domain